MMSHQHSHKAQQQAMKLPTTTPVAPQSAVLYQNQYQHMAAPPSNAMSGGEGHDVYMQSQ